MWLPLHSDISVRRCVCLCRSVCSVTYGYGESLKIWTRVRLPQGRECFLSGRRLDICTVDYCVSQALGCGLMVLCYWRLWTYGAPCCAQSYKVGPGNKEYEFLCGCINCVWSFVDVHFFKPTCSTLPCVRAYVCAHLCLCVCQSVSWGKIISSLLSGSPRGLLSCWALLEPAQGEADMTAVLENEARRTITPSASIFVLQHDVSTSVLCAWNEGHMLCIL